MSVKIRTVLQFLEDPRQEEAGFLAALRRAMETTLARWKTRTLPFHFTWKGAGVYGYRPRTSRYLKDKRKRGKPPLVLSGRAKFHAFHGRITASASRSSVSGKYTMEMPPYIRFSPPSGPPMADEILALTPNEANALAAFLDDQLTVEVERSRREALAAQEARRSRREALALAAQGARFRQYEMFRRASRRESPGEAAVAMTDRE